MTRRPVPARRQEGSRAATNGPVSVAASNIGKARAPRRSKAHRPPGHPKPRCRVEAAHQAPRPVRTDRHAARGTDRHAAQGIVRGTTTRDQARKRPLSAKGL